MRYRVRAESRGELLGDGELVIGRSSYCTLVLEHPSVSRVHASIRLIEGKLELTDLGSSNGTFVRGVRIKEPTIVEPSGDVRVGSLPIWIEEVRSRDAFDTTRRRLEEELAAPEEFETLEIDENAKQLGRATGGPSRGGGS